MISHFQPFQQLKTTFSTMIRQWDLDRVKRGKTK